MPTLTVERTLWRDLESVAHKRQLSAQQLALRALREYLQRADDEELLAQSNRAAHRARFTMSETEEIVRRHRRRKLQSLQPR
jgi:hypothetical protein